MRESKYLEGNEQIVETLQSIPVFKNFSEGDLHGLVRVTKLRSFSPMEVIIEEGDTAKYMYILISGNVTVCKGASDIVTLRRTGDIFGEMSLLEEEPRSASVISATETSCLLIDANYLETIKDEGKDSFHAAIYHMFAQILAYRLRLTTEKYTEATKEIEVLRRELSLLLESKH